MKRKILPIIIMCVALIILLLPVTAHATDVEVGTWAELKDALNVDGNNITLTHDIDGEGAAEYLLVGIGKTVSLDLAGHTINRNLTEATADGYVLRVDGVLTITDSEGGGSITGGNNTGSGGGIYVYLGATLNMNAGSVTGNTANNGGGIYDRGTVYMTAGSVTGNTANYAAGVRVDGSFYMSGSAAISDNTAGNSYNGGGVYIYDGGNFVMSSGSIMGNRAGMGGGICVQSGNCNIEGGTISGNTAVYAGGGVYNNKYFGMTGGTIELNTAGTSGGGVYINSVYGNTGEIYGGTIRNNTATNYGGGVYWDATESVLRIHGDPTISGNVKGGTITAGVLTGGTASNLYIGGSRKIIVSGELTNATPIGVFTSTTPGVGTPVTITQTTTGYIDKFVSDRGLFEVTANASGYAQLSVKEGTPEITSWSDLSDALQVSGTYALGADLEYDGANSLVVPSGKTVTLDLKGHTIDRALGSAESDGWVIRLTSSTSNLTINDSVGGGLITGGKNSSSSLADAGGGINVCYGTLTMNGGSISGNVCGKGGGVYVFCGTFTMNGGTIGGSGTPNYGTEGAGVYIYGGTFNLAGGTVSYNEATNYGGGVYIYDSGILNITDGGIDHNTVSTYDGGGIYMSSGSVNMSGGSISYNSTLSDNRYGAGVCTWANGCTFEISGGSISYNDAGSLGRGGGICLYYGSATISGTAVISHNTARTGGGIDVWSGTALTMSGGTISDNEAEAGGGVRIQNSGTTFNMTGGSIADNTTTGGSGNGAGVNMSNGTFNMSGGSITGNTTNSTSGGKENYGAGVYYGGGTFNLSGGSITGNTCAIGGNGSGILVYSSSFNVEGNPIVTGNARNNIYLWTLSTYINITGALDSEARLGVQSYSMVAPITVTSGLGAYGTAANFISDYSTFFTYVDSGEVKLFNAPDIIYAHNMRLSSEIGLGFKFRFPAEQGKDGAYVTFHLNTSSGEEIGRMNMSEATVDEENDTYFWFTVYLDPLALNDKIVATLHYGQGLTISTGAYAAEDYIDDAKTKYSGNAELIALLNALGTYCNYLQRSGWTDGKVHATVSYFDIINEDHISSAITDLTASSYDIEKDYGSSGVSKIKYSLSLEEKTTINIYVKVGDGVEVEDYDGTREFEDGTYYRVRSAKIDASDLTTKVNVVISTSEGGAPKGTATISVSALSYIKAFINHETEGIYTFAKKQALVALKNYAEAASAYAATLTP